MDLTKHVGLRAYTVRCKEGGPRPAIEIPGSDEGYESTCHEGPLRRNPASFLQGEGTVGSITMTVARELQGCQGQRGSMSKVEASVIVLERNLSGRGHALGVQLAPR